MPPAKRRQAAAPKNYSSAIAVEKAVQVLNLLADNSQATLTDITRALGHGKTALLRVLNALVRQGLVQQDPATGAYSMTWRVLALAHSVARNADIRSVALPYMHELRDFAEETVTLSARVNFQRVCIEEVEGPHELRWRTGVGSLGPLYAGSTGKMFLATLGRSELKQFFDTVEFRDLAPGAKVTRTELRAEAEKIRKQGFCYDHDTRVRGVAGLSAPIFDRFGDAVAVLTIGGPTERFQNVDLDRWRDRLLAATRELTSLTGRAETDTSS